VEVADFGNMQVYVNEVDIVNVLSHPIWAKNIRSHMTAMTGRASFRFIPLKGSWNSIQHPMAFTLLILNKTLRWLIFWSMMQILMMILLHLPLPLCINFISTLSARTLRDIQKNKYNKLCALIASWAWSPAPPNTISKPWYVSIYSKTALSQTTTFAMLTTSMALTWH
jgi:hypothetical protein